MPNATVPAADRGLSVSRALKALICGHSSARKRWLDSCRARDAAQERYGAMARDAGLRTQLDDPEIHQEERERIIETCARDLDAQLAKLDAEHASLTRLREASGFAAADAANDIANQADEDAFAALCAYSCQTIEEARLWAAHIARRWQLYDDSRMDMALRALAGGAPDDED